LRNKNKKLNELLFILDRDPNISLKRLSSILKLNVKTVDKHLKELKEKNLLFSTNLINFYNVGFFLTRFLVNVKNLSNDFPLLLKALNKFDIHWASEISENYNLTIDFLLNNYESLMNLVHIFEELVEKELINSFEYFFINEIYFFNYFKNQINTNSVNERSSNFRVLKQEKFVKLKSEELKILSLFSKGLNKLEIKKSTKFSYSFISRIIDNLRKENVILGKKYFFSPGLLNKTPYKLLVQTTRNGKYYLKVIKFLRNKEDVILLSKTSSSYDLEIYLLTDDYKNLLDLISELKQFDGFIKKVKIITINKDLINTNFALL